MSLPDVRSALPTEVTAPHAARVANFLRSVDQQLEELVELTIYGSAAISLYLADADEFEVAYTEDIDVGKMEPDAVESLPTPDVVATPLEFQDYKVDKWMVHPDWEDDVVSVQSLLDTENLKVRLLHPIDLIITKLERFDSQDVEDGRWLYERYAFGAEVACQRLREAWQTYLTSSHKTDVIQAAFESIFEEACGFD